MKDSRRLREILATFTVGGLGVVAIKYLLGPTVEKNLKARAR